MTDDKAPDAPVIGANEAGGGMNITPEAPGKKPKGRSPGRPHKAHSGVDKMTLDDVRKAIPDLAYRSMLVALRVNDSQLRAINKDVRTSAVRFTLTLGADAKFWQTIKSIQTEQSQAQKAKPKDALEF